MALSRMYNALKLSNKSSTLRNSFFYKQQGALSHIKDAILIINTNKKQQIPNASWLSSLLPVAFALSAGSFAFQTNHSQCDPPNPDQRYKYFIIIIVIFVLIN